VIEPDQSYEFAASSKASGGVRQLFSRPENVLMSRYTHDVIREWAQWSTGAGEPQQVSDLDWKPNGYLFIADPARSEQLRTDFEQQRSLGVEAEWVEPSEIGRRYPHLSPEGLGPAVLSPRDGWLDPHAFLRGLRNRGRALGATSIQARVMGFEVSGRRIVSAGLESGEAVLGDSFVNVAGVWGPELSVQLGLRLPVEPMRRFDHYVETRADFAGYPFVKDPGGLAVRPEGRGLTAALVDLSHPGGYDLSIDRSYFETTVWPALVDRFPVTDELRLVSTWAGLYDQNRLDGNMILDRWSSELDNYYFATGFSGHGLMHAPAVGRALAELILYKSFQTIDLTRMGLERILTGTPYAELTIR
jgi:glycine/D-amino acid oxidase-like deaminating enzyme